MNILAIDTSSQNATVALLSEERLIGEFTINNKKTQRIVESTVFFVLHQTSASESFSRGASSTERMAQRAKTMEVF